MSKWRDPDSLHEAIEQRNEALDLLWEYHIRDDSSTRWMERRAALLDRLLVPEGQEPEMQSAQTRVRVEEHLRCGRTNGALLALADAIDDLARKVAPLSGEDGARYLLGYRIEDPRKEGEKP